MLVSDDVLLKNGPHSAGMAPQYLPTSRRMADTSVSVR